MNILPIRDDVRAMPAYHVQDASGMIKLDAMENPYRLPDALQTELGAHLGAVVLNRYPAAGSTALCDAIAKAFAIDPALSVMLGNGSDELIHLLIQACAKDGASVLAPEPGFVMYKLSCIYNRVRYVGVPVLPDSFALDMPAMLAAIAQHSPAITFIAYPNNPTGNCWAQADIENIIAACAQYGGLVVIDEAYQPFAAQSWLSQIARYPNVILIRTLSKLGLAGLRLGYLVAAPTIVNELNKVRPPYNVNVLTEAACLFLFNHLAVFDAQAAEIKIERSRLFTALQALSDAGVQPYPSEANFILSRVPDSIAWFAALKTRGILVKNMQGAHPLLANCLRLTVGDNTENTALIKALTEISQGQ